VQNDFVDRNNNPVSTPSEAALWVGGQYQSFLDFSDWGNSWLAQDGSSINPE
jgi:hypothetical protein